MAEESENQAEDASASLYNRMIRFMDVKFHINIELGKTTMTIREMVELKAGSIIHLNKSAGEAIEIFANGELIAKGEVIVLEENFGIRITDIADKK